MAEDDDIETESDSADAAPEIPSPRENPLLLGHQAAEAALLQAYNSGRLSHAWLLAGPRGIGKATLAFRFARFLFAQGAGAGGLVAAPATSLAIAPSQASFRLVVSGGHPDLLVVERGLDPKRKRQRREIVAEEARGVAEFLHLTSAQGGWRVVVVDGADLLNIPAANSLLKILEEPPRQTVLLLASDSPGMVLPTIRSRCRMLAMKPLADDVMAELLQRFRPDLSATDRAMLSRLADGSIGRALDLASSDGVVIYNSAFNILRNLPRVDYEAIHGLAERLARAGAEDGFELFGELLSASIARLVALGGQQGAKVSPEEERVMRALAARRGLDQWVEVWEKLTHLFAQGGRINLDRKQVVLNACFALEEAAR